MARTNLKQQGPHCMACGTPTEDLDENDECFDCADVDEPTPETICFECGNDIGPYEGVCLDCLEELSSGEEDDEDPPW